MEGCFGGNDLSKYAEQNLASYTIHLYLIKTGEKKTYSEHNFMNISYSTQFNPLFVVETPLLAL